MKKRTAKEGIPAAALMLTLCLMLGGCDSWRRSASPEEIPVSGGEVQELPAEEDWEEAWEEALEAETLEEGEAGIEMIRAEVIDYGDGSLFWSSEDEVLSGKLYSLLMHQNELFSEKFDEREYDYQAILTDEEGTETNLFLWINFQRENEVIVEDDAGNQWNLSVEDSNHLRSLVSSFG